MGHNPQIRLTKMDEGGDMKNRVRIQMNELNLVEMQKTTEESASGDRESAIEERFKNHDLTGIRGREGFSIGGAPPDDLLLGKNPSFTIRWRCSSVTVDLCHTCSGGGISAIGEKRDGIGARGKLSRRRKTPNRTAALKTGAAAEDGRRKQRKLLRREKT